MVNPPSFITIQFTPTQALAAVPVELSDPAAGSAGITMATPQPLSRTILWQLVDSVIVSALDSNLVLTAGAPYQENNAELTLTLTPFAPGQLNQIWTIEPASGQSTGFNLYNSGMFLTCTALDVILQPTGSDVTPTALLVTNLLNPNYLVVEIANPTQQTLSLIAVPKQGNVDYAGPIIIPPTSAIMVLANYTAGLEIEILVTEPSTETQIGSFVVEQRPYRIGTPDGRGGAITLRDQYSLLGWAWAEPVLVPAANIDAPGYVRMKIERD